MFVMDTVLTIKDDDLFKMISKNFKEIFEIVYYLTDFFLTLNSALAIQTKLAEFLFEYKFEKRWLDLLGLIYPLCLISKNINNAIFFLFKSIRDLSETTLFDLEDILSRMKQYNEHAETAGPVKLKIKCLKYQLAKTLNSIITNCCVKPIIDNLDSSNCKSSMLQHQAEFYFDNFLKLCCDLLEDKRLLCYYEQHFGLLEQIELVYQLSDNRMWV